VVPIPAQLADDMKAAREHADALLEDERFAQAAEVLGEVLEPAAAALGVDNRKVLDLRQRRAAVLFLGGDFRTALPEFDALAEAYARTSGPAGPSARLCRAQAAHCRAELGQVTAALEQFEAVLRQVTAVASDADEEAIELRRAIGFLLLSEGRYAEAREVLEALHEDLCLIVGPDDEETVEIADALTRIRLAYDSRNPRTPRG
jgi:tetratricopeptide (TPR) repeat protein